MDNEQILLSNDKVANFRKAKGKDLFDALRLANGEPSDITKLLIAKIVTIDQKNITEFDIDDLPLEDVLLLIEKLNSLYPFLSQKKK
ncbi:MAG: hypothetical protein KatS3mg068_2505 [Candidatus Sericytochromatia bacterium]|nr:MAG: hypothetical protein KatS3mg068_1897 [Candidatus Sericytochromatia bacterium]GIW23498.1 MAG: hypothetical protein KatS3mg068_2505 [Candidatus Sericytochromatia bacterium]